MSGVEGAKEGRSAENRAGGGTARADRDADEVDCKTTQRRSAEKCLERAEGAAEDGRGLIKICQCE